MQTQQYKQFFKDIYIYIDGFEQSKAKTFIHTKKKLKVISEHRVLQKIVKHKNGIIIRYHTIVRSLINIFA